MTDLSRIRIPWSAGSTQGEISMGCENLRLTSSQWTRNLLALAQTLLAPTLLRLIPGNVGCQRLTAAFFQELPSANGSSLA